MKRVYTIEVGSYSDYHVIGVYSTKQRAQIVYDALKEAGEYELNDIVERELDPAVDAIRKGLFIFHVLMLRDGTVEGCTKGNISGYNIERSIKPPRIWRRTQAPAYKGRDVPDVLECSVFARDTTHAIKIANEKRTMMIANGEWD
jgi:hypothetical protein